jgi:hypothetical protein
MASFRDDVRKIAIAGGSSKEILELCDRFRDQDLANLGVQLDDGQGACESQLDSAHEELAACVLNVADAL